MNTISKIGLHILQVTKWYYKVLWCICELIHLIMQMMICIGFVLVFLCPKLVTVRSIRIEGDRWLRELGWGIENQAQNHQKIVLRRCLEAMSHRTCWLALANCVCFRKSPVIIRIDRGAFRYSQDECRIIRIQYNLIQSISWIIVYLIHSISLYPHSHKSLGQ